MNNSRTEIFISHRKTDAAVAEMIKDFLVVLGIPNDSVFCSSLAGNDVKQCISPEVKAHLKNAKIIILILSNDFYKSAYCLNEAGVAWYLDDVLVIPFNLPEIKPENMIGFFDSDNKLRSLNNNDDISYLYEQSQEQFNVEQAKPTLLSREINKLISKYNKYINEREESIDNDDNNHCSTNDFKVGDEILLESAFNELINFQPKSLREIDHVPIDSAFILVYAAAGSGRILKIKNMSSYVDISVDGKRFFASNSARESAKWEEALRKLVSWGWIEPEGNKNQVFKVTGTGYDIADELKAGMLINTDVEPLQEIKKFN